MKTNTYFDPMAAGLPANDDAERFLIGSVLLDGSQMQTIRDLIAESDFANPRHQLIWAVMSAMHDAGDHLDHSTVGFKLHDSGNVEAAGGLGYLVSLTDGLPMLSNLDSYAAEIRSKATKRRAILKCHEILVRLSQTGEDAADVFADAQEAMSKLGGELHDAGGFRTPAEVIRGAGGTDLYLQRRRAAGISTPFPTLNQMTGGFRPGDLVVIAAQTGHGKTALAVNLARHAAKQGHACAIFSLEMDAEQITDRVISAAGINSRLLRAASVTGDAEQRAPISRAIADAAELPIYISDRNRHTVPAMTAELRRLASKQKLGLVIVDYIQLASGVGRSANRADEVAGITRALKRMAGELAVPVIALSQFNRESAKDNREPQLHDLRESGSIEQDASLVMMIHFGRLPDVNAGIDTGDAKLLVRKQRNGPTGWLPLTFHAPSGRFFEQGQEAVHVE